GDGRTALRPARAQRCGAAARRTWHRKDDALEGRAANAAGRRRGADAGYTAARHAGRGAAGYSRRLWPGGGRRAERDAGPAGAVLARAAPSGRVRAVDY